MKKKLIVKNQTKNCKRGASDQPNPTNAGRNSNPLNNFVDQKQRKDYRNTENIKTLGRKLAFKKNIQTKKHRNNDSRDVGIK